MSTLYNPDPGSALYVDSKGSPLNGVIYFGVPNLNPVTNPVTVYWDAAGTQPAAQPISVSNGRTVRQDGTPSQVWISGDYSKLAVDAGGRQVVFEPNQQSPLIPQTATVDTFSGTGASATYTLSVTPSSKNDTSVFVGGVYQEKSSYTLAGNQLTINAALGTNNVEVVTTENLDWTSVSNTINTAVAISQTASNTATTEAGIATTQAANAEAAAAAAQSYVSPVSVADYTGLRAYNGTAVMLNVTGYIATSTPSGIAGTFTRDDHDTTTADNGATVIVDALGRRWKRVYDGSVNSEWFTTVDQAIAEVKLETGGKLIVDEDYSLAADTLVAGEFSHGLAVDGKNSTLTYSAGGLVLGNYATPGVEYRLKTKVYDLNVTGVGKATVGSYALKIDSTADVITYGGIYKNAETALWLNGGLICDFYNTVFRDSKNGVLANLANAFSPNLNNFFAAKIRTNDVAISYDNNPNSPVNWFGCDIEGNNSAGTPTDGVSVVKLTNAGHHNFIGTHFEANPGQYGIDYTGLDTSKGLLVVGSEVIHNADTVLEMRQGKLTVIASRVTNASATNDIHLETGTTATLIDSDARVSGDSSHLLSINYGRICFGAQAINGQVPIQINSTAYNSNRAMLFKSDITQFEWDNAAGTRIAYMSVQNATDSGFVSTQAYGWKFYSNNVVNFYIGRSAALAIEPGADNTHTCGSAPLRFSTVYAGTGTINTSDAREKQQVRALSDAERAVAVRCKGLLRAFKFNDAVAEKGDAARIHFGVIAQDVIAAFQAEGLDATKYALLCYDEWLEVPEQRDDEGNVTAAYMPAGNRYGVRYEELLAFMLAAL